jgi:spore germination protein GerM
MTALQTTPTGAGTSGLRTALPADGEPVVTAEERGQVTIDLSPTFGDNAGDDYRLAIAQMVLTFTIQPGVSQVTFTRNGEATQVQLADGRLSDAGQVLYRADFENLLGSPIGPTTTSTTTTVAPDPTDDPTRPDATSSVPGS